MADLAPAYARDRHWLSGDAMNDGLTIAKDLADRRERMVSRLSPMARHRAFPKVYAQPLPRIGSVEEYEAENNELKATIARLHRELATAKATIDKLVLKKAARSPTASVLSCGIVMRAFCEALKDVGITVNGVPITVAHLESPIRSAPYAGPRHVCMWLCHVLLKPSSTKIGMAFGGRDHTSALHGIERAAGWMAENPLLKVAADLVADQLAQAETGEQSEAGAV